MPSPRTGELEKSFGSRSVVPARNSHKERKTTCSLAASNDSAIRGDDQSSDRRVKNTSKIPSSLVHLNRKEEEEETIASCAIALNGWDSLSVATATVVCEKIWYKYRVIQGWPSSLVACTTTQSHTHSVTQFVHVSQCIHRSFTLCQHDQFVRLNIFLAHISPRQARLERRDSDSAEVHARRRTFLAECWLLREKRVRPM